MSAPVVVTGEQGVQGTLTPEAIAGVLTFRADPSGLVPEINVQAATEALDPQLASSETPGRDAVAGLLRPAGRWSPRPRTGAVSTTRPR